MRTFRGPMLYISVMCGGSDSPHTETTDETKKLVKLYLLLPANKRKLLFAYLYGLCDGEYISL